MEHDSRRVDDAAQRRLLQVLKRRQHLPGDAGEVDRLAGFHSFAHAVQDSSRLRDEQVSRTPGVDAP